jgi:hypothetical protein
LLFSLRDGAAQNNSNPFDYLKQSLVKILLASAVLGNQLQNYDYVNGNCLYGAYLAKGEYQGLGTQFTAGEEYLIIGAGDEDIIDLDLAIVSANNTVIIKDDKRDALPILRYTPQTTGRRTIRLINFDAARSGFCAMIVLRKTDYGNLSFDQISEALDNVIAMAQLSGALSTASGFAKNTFCLFGGRVASGNEMYLYNVGLNYGKYLFVGAGSDNISDVDIFVVEQYGQDNTSGQIVCKDTADDKTPFCSFRASSSSYYQLKYKNFSSYRSGFIFTVLLTAQ